MFSTGLNEIVAIGCAKGASDIHLAAGQRPFLRLAGEMSPLAKDCLTKSVLADFLLSLLTEKERARLFNKKSMDFSCVIEGQRCRAHAYRMNDAWALALRLLPHEVAPLAQLGTPQALASLLNASDGLILVGGRTGAGKSTTLAAFIEEINMCRSAHIVTLEDPIEYVFTPKRSFFSQRSLGRDFLSFPTGLRDALREDPDVIFIGEMRDAKTVRIALQAAESGCLVLATLHTKDAAEAILRVEGMFPGEEAQVRSQLSIVLQAVFSQRLLTARQGGRVLAAEALIASPAVRNLIRKGKTAQLKSAILAGKAAGMQTMAQAVERLFREGKITKEVKDTAIEDISANFSDWHTL